MKQVTVTMKKYIFLAVAVSVMGVVTAFFSQPLSAKARKSSDS